MKPNVFLPEIALKVENVDRENAILKCINDKGERVTVVVLNKNQRPTKEEFESFIEKKAEKAVSKTILDTLVEKMSESKIVEEIENKIISENSEIVRKPREFAKKLNDELAKEAKKIAENMYTLDRGMIIKIGGITNKDGKVISAKMDFNLSNKKNPGFYILSVPNDKNPIFRRVPVKLIPLKDFRYKVVTNSAFSSIDDIKEVLRGFLRTLKAYEEKKVKAKPSISFNILKSKNPSAQETKLMEKINNYNELSKDGKIDFKQAATLLKDIIEFIEANNLSNKIEVFFPLEPVSIKMDEFLQKVKEKMIRTSFSNSLSSGKIKPDDIDNFFKDVMENSRPVLLTTYKLKTEKDSYGFFSENVNLSGALPHSSFYERLIDKEKELVHNKQIQKKSYEKEKNQSPSH